jgi:ABC-2 type transport system ATP-binding protein
MIQAEHLSKSYRKKVAVDDISFEIATGKVTGFLGPNGAGKSTTMRLMLGLDNGGGTTLFDDQPLSKHPRPSRVVGVLLEAKAFHPTRTARDHLRVLAAAGGIGDNRVDEVLNTVGLQEVASKRPGKFSLGMSQRLGIAAAILGEPKYLILDEPANGLDPEGIHWLRQFIKDYADKGNAVFVSSHLLSEMALMADDLVVIGKGKLITSGSVNSFVNNAKGTGVFVRTEKAKYSALERILKSKHLELEKIDDPVGGLTVKGATTDEIGRLAFEAGVPVLELAGRNASLEEAFLEITAGSQEYSTQDVPKPPKPSAIGKGDKA